MTFLDDRRRGAEEAFFAKQNEALRLQLRTSDVAEAARAQVAGASGIRDGAVLDALEGLHVGPEGAAALSLIPLVAVAWADGDVSPEEREALLSAAAENGLAPDGAAHRLFAGWLDDKPSEMLFARWTDYASAVVGGLAPAARAAFRRELLNKAQAVAGAAGGFLGFGRVSAAEQAVLDEVDRTLSA